MIGNPFKLARRDGGDGPAAAPVLDDALRTRIKGLVDSAPVFLFMKGSPAMPQCGFSANVVAILDSLGVEYKTFDILTDPAVRQGAKEFSDWPTFPQLYAKGGLVGGNDIVTELHRSGGLRAALGT